MQDIQNIPSPDVNSTETNEDFGNHPETERDDVENIPLPNDELQRAPVEEPPSTEQPEIDEDNDEPKRIL